MVVEFIFQVNPNFRNKENNPPPEKKSDYDENLHDRSRELLEEYLRNISRFYNISTIVLLLIVEA